FLPTAALAGLLLFLGLRRPIPGPALAPVATAPAPRPGTRPALLPPAAEAPPAAPAGARVESVAGTALVLDHGRSRKAEAGEPVTEAAGVFTRGPGSRVVVAFEDHTRLELGGESVLAQLADG